ncbi:MAG TPA: O-methyltransferase, partial [Ktedonobacterales bacterium]|nr:O-methyltransferase [Ktedonobacterales bacterium]
AAARSYINTELTRRFAPEDDALRGAVEAAQAAGMPAIQVSPLRGRLLQVLAAACGARKMLEIGALAGYSGIWLARALPADGRLISLEISEQHAAVARASLARAGVADRAEVRVGAGADLLPGLEAEAPFDLVFIDANKDGYPQYLEWALQLTRPGSIIVADNCVRGGEPLRGDSADEGNRGIASYDAAIAANPRLRSIVLPMDLGMDGVAISVVVA